MKLDNFVLPFLFYVKIQYYSLKKSFKLKEHCKDNLFLIFDFFFICLRITKIYCHSSITNQD